ncbi:NAD(P)-dependent oxidoreductase [Mucilaginibacter sp. SMC90]|uniref:NAD(P)-dependent oxidoreductase n=1 Tax=Mucilaginibacter sp. SMC90 TaxID=2929803 RepID=UPI001FB2CC02|nr:NAD(P)-dependent oxidoreductase [Mucilaginibacter sp. SMC90]UOE51569.1 NAD(P)-dependent oxidoreductase [Mucilaginibacter sp. SMC90]
MKTKIGFIGLGNMGTSIARNLIDSGYHLQVYNRTLSKIDELGTDNVTKCLSPAEAAADVPFLITMVSDDEVLRESTVGDGGILKTLQPNAVHISMSTISPETSVELAKLHEQAGSRYLASPVFGRPEAAAARKLWICISGDEQTKADARPILDLLGQQVVDFGPTAGGANVVKIAGNFMIMASMEMMAEAFTLAEKNGLSRTLVSDFFSSTLFNAPIFQNYGKALAGKQYQPVGFKAKLGYKDARLAFKLSQTSEMPMPIANAVHGRLLTAVARGWGESDWVEGIGRGVSEDAGL